MFIFRTFYERNDGKWKRDINYFKLDFPIFRKKKKNGVEGESLI